MNKIKLLAPLFTTGLVIGGIVPIATSCGKTFTGEVNETEWQEGLLNIYSSTRNLTYYTDGYISVTNFNQGKMSETEWYTDFVVNNDLQEAKCYGSSYNNNGSWTIEEAQLTSKRFYDTYLISQNSKVGERYSTSWNINDKPVNSIMEEIFGQTYDKYKYFVFVPESKYYLYFDTWDEDWLNITITFNSSYRIQNIEFVYADLVSASDPTVKMLATGNLEFIYGAKSLTFPDNVTSLANGIVKKMEPTSTKIEGIQSLPKDFDNRVIITLDATTAHEGKNTFTFTEELTKTPEFKSGQWYGVFVNGAVGGSANPENGTVILTEPIKAGQKINICVPLSSTKTYTCTLS